MATRRRRHAPARAAAAVASYSSPACYRHEFEPDSSAAHGFALKRIYAQPGRSDGFRVLVDRLWPRGISKQRAALDAWLPEVAPSTALRKWFHRDPKRWQEFGRRYRAELRTHAAQLQDLRRRASQQRVTLLYGARDARINHAVVLHAVLRRSGRATPTPISRA